MAIAIRKTTEPLQELALMVRDGERFTRTNDGQVLRRSRGDPLEERGAFNPAIILLDGNERLGHEYLMAYRTEDVNHRSRIRLATSHDGLKWDKLGITIPSPAPHLQLEDPRLTVMEDNSKIMFCTQYNWENNSAQIVIYAFTGKESQGFFEKIGEVRNGDANHFDKDGALFPRKIQGWFVAFKRPMPNMEIMVAKDLAGPWTQVTQGFMAPRAGMWDSHHIGAGGPPILTSEGWLSNYHGVDNKLVYSLGATIFDLHFENGDITNAKVQIHYRSDTPILKPEKQWERRSGVPDPDRPGMQIGVPNVVFTCNLLQVGNELWTWYAGADFSIGVARLGNKIADDK